MARAKASRTKRATTALATREIYNPESGRVFTLVNVDAELVAMIRDHIATVRAVFPDSWDVPTWDRPHDPSCYDDDLPGIFEDPGLLGEYCHAVGFIAGCAATFDVTPGELVRMFP